MEQACLSLPDLRGGHFRGTLDHGSSHRIAARQLLGQLAQDRLERDFLLLPSSQYVGNKSSGYGQRRLPMPQSKPQRASTLGTGMLAQALRILDESGLESDTSAASSNPCSPKYLSRSSPKSSLDKSKSYCQLSPVNPKSTIEAPMLKCKDRESRFAPDYGCSEPCSPVAPPASWMELLPEPVQPKQSQDRQELSARYVPSNTSAVCTDTSTPDAGAFFKIHLEGLGSPVSDSSAIHQNRLLEGFGGSPVFDCSRIQPGLEALGDSPVSDCTRIQPGLELPSCTFSDNASSRSSSRPVSAPTCRPTQKCSQRMENGTQTKLRPDTEHAWASGVLRHGEGVMARQEALLEWVDQIIAEDTEPQQQRQHTARRLSLKNARHTEEAGQQRSKWAVAKKTLLQNRTTKLLKTKLSPGGGGPVSDREAATLSDLPPLDPQVLDGLFHGLQSNGEICTDQLPEALSKLDNRGVKMEWVEEIVEKLFSNRSLLDRSEFVQFCTMYQSYSHRFLMDIFREVDVDDSHTISVAEVSMLLNHRGITPVPGSLEELFREITGEMKLRDVNFEEFVQIYDKVHMRAGFTEQELEQLQKTWSRFDVDGNGTLDCDELRAALRWEGFAVDDRIIKHLLQEVVPDKGFVTQEEYLVLVRRYREEELQKAVRLFRRRHPHYEGRTIPRDALLLVLSGLGYTSASPDVIGESIESVFERTKNSAVPKTEHAALECNKKADLTFEDLHLLLSFVRESRGFVRAEIAEIHAAFDIFCKDELGTYGDSAAVMLMPNVGIDAEDQDLNAGLNTIQLTSALRWLGYPAVVWKVQELLESLDLGGIWNISRSDFMKFMGSLRNRESVCVRRRLASHGQGTAGTLKRILRDLGYMMAMPNISELMSSHKDALSGDQGPWGIHHMLRKYREDLRSYFAQNHGFSMPEVARLQLAFKRLDAKGADKLVGKVFSQLLKELFPGIDQTREDQQKARQLLHIALGSHTSSSQLQVTFQDYLFLVRLRINQWTSEWVSEERHQIQTCHFSASEVKEFRLLFNQAAVREADGSTLANSSNFSVGDAVVPLLSLSHTAIQKMVTKVTGSCNKAESKALKQLLHNFDAEDRGVLNFGQFLQTIRKMINDNWHNINIEAEIIATQQQQQQL